MKTFIEIIDILTWQMELWESESQSFSISFLSNLTAKLDRLVLDEEAWHIWHVGTSPSLKKEQNLKVSWDDFFKNSQLSY